MLPLSHRIRRRNGFTLVELLVVVLILAILLSIALPLYTASVADSEKKAARTNMQTIATAVAAYKIRDTNHAYPTDINALVSTTNGPADLTTVPAGPGARTYVLLFPSGANAVTSCYTYYNNAGSVSFGSQPIPADSFAVTSVLNGTQQDQLSNGDGCYIPGVSVQ